jgi:glycosyltransferase involved in cell wall biosynthesis/SAM-dependent methyltransferase
VHICTIIACNYVAFARVLADTFRTHHPDGTCWVLVIDELHGRIDADAEPFEVVTPADLRIERFEQMAALYSVLELSTAVKPWLLRHLLGDRGVERITYLDPDIEVHDSLQDVDELLRDHHLVLNPHLLKPMRRDGAKPSESDILIAGSFNLGFVGLAAGEDTDFLLDWWAERLVTDCRVDPERGYFVDQRWMDFAPGLVPSLEVLRDPGYNVAYWNLPGRRLARAGSGGYTADGRPLRFMHYSGFDPATPDVLSKHQTRLRVADDPVLAELCRGYADRLWAAGHDEARRWPYAYDTLPDGTAIDEHMRAVYREAVEEDALPRSVFAPEGTEEFEAYLRGPAAAGGRHGVTRYLAAVREARSELRDAFPSLEGARGLELAGWADAFGRHEVPNPQFLFPAEAGAAALNGSGPPLAGVNVAGYFSSVLGVGEAARQVIGALRSAGLEVAPLRVSEKGGRGNLEDPELSVPDAEPRYPVNLVCVNADMLPVFADDVGPAFFDARYTIGLWWWEVSSFPERWLDSFEHVDEVWAGSRHVADALAAVSPVPVVHTTVPVTVPPFAPRTRAELGLPEGFLFLFTFDHNSVFARKNPLGLIEAFMRAFEPGSGAALVIKAINGDQHPEHHTALVEAAGAHPDVHLIDRYVSRGEKDAMIDACDVYVSLHRAEGFGFPLAEAMWLGKPVIATGYSGNVDFMTPQNSWLVDHRLVPIGEGAEPYPPSGRWAEPDLDHAATLMREAFADPEATRARGERGQAEVRARYSPEAAGAAMVERLAHLPRLGGGLSPRTAARSGADGDAARIARRVRSGPVPPARPRFGRPQRLVRRTLLRLIKPFTAHQKMVDEDLLRYGVSAHARLDDLAGQVDVLRSQLEQGSRFMASFGLGGARPEPAVAPHEGLPAAPAEPWSHAYNDAHRDFVVRVLDDPRVLARFRRGERLDAGYGIGFDERVVELPWLFTRDLGGRVLDAGSTLNHPHVLARLLPRVDDLAVVTLAPEAEAHPYLGVSYLYADLRDLPLRDGVYDHVVSLSTLEHVGMDTTHFGARTERAQDPSAELSRALSELRRVLAPGGTLVLTVPFGAAEDFGWLRVFSAEDLDLALGAFGPAERRVTYFAYDAGGWQVADTAEAAGVRYRDPFTQPVGEDRAVAARAVACVELRTS